MLESREPHLRPNRGLVNGEVDFYKGIVSLIHGNIFFKFAIQNGLKTEDHFYLFETELTLSLSSFLSVGKVKQNKMVAPLMSDNQQIVSIYHSERELFC